MSQLERPPDKPLLYRELRQGRLRQGWGISGLSLRNTDGNPVSKAEWESAHRQTDWGEPSQMRFAILNRMLELHEGDIVVVPKTPKATQFTVARVSGPYRFQDTSNDDGEFDGDFGHVIPVVADSIRTFEYRASDAAYSVSALFGKANHRQAVTFCYSGERIGAAERLLQRQDSTESKSSRELLQGAFDLAFRKAARTLSKQVRKWNGPRFENAVRQCFEDQGYQVKPCQRYDGEGADVDMVVLPPVNRHGLFLPTEIAVQVKWKQQTDGGDVVAVDQISRWAEWQESSAMKCVISSADRFTDEAKKRAKDEDVILICGLQTMCFLLGVPDRYREDWEQPCSS